ncbi:MAG: histidine phosphatase family protein [Sandaracinaceae bacterium]|nr:histidine phosphatase family protein [Sandaracinaceae bacterium]
MPHLRLCLMRHAKSSWSSGAPSDHERPLNGRGRRDAPKLGAELARRGWTPDHVLSSDSARTTETLARMREALGFAGSPELRADLYHGGIDELRAAIAALPDGALTVLALGHNPGWEEALDWLAGHDGPMKTGSCALLVVDAPSWRDAADREGGWRVEALIHPRSL